MHRVYFKTVRSPSLRTPLRSPQLFVGTVNIIAEAVLVGAYSLTFPQILVCALYTLVAGSVARSGNDPGAYRGRMTVSQVLHIEELEKALLRLDDSVLSSIDRNIVHLHHKIGGETISSANE